MLLLLHGTGGAGTLTPSVADDTGSSSVFKSLNTLPSRMTPIRRNDFRSRGHAGYWAFVVHRISGIALTLFLPLHFFV